MLYFSSSRFKVVLQHSDAAISAKNAFDLEPFYRTLCHAF